MNKTGLFEKMKMAVIEGDKHEAESLAQNAVESKMELIEVIEKGFTPGIQKAGDLWESGEYFLPELISSAECMTSAMKILQPELIKAGVSAKTLGKVIIGTIEGDIHDIGKNLVASMLAANGFEITDLGADVKLEKFISKAQEINADYICLSSLLTTTMIGQKKIITMLKDKKLFGHIKVMVGGAPVNSQWARDIGADGYAENAITAVTAAKKLL
jgi:trimethylamine corrinoid protein